MIKFQVCFLTSADELDKSLNQAIHMTEELHKQVVIVYSKARGQLTDIYSVVLERGNGDDGEHRQDRKNSKGQINASKLL